MKIHCPSCNAKYSIADDKVRGKRVKVRCKTCGQPIQVDGTQLDDDAAGLDDADDDGATQIMQSPFAARGPAGVPRPGAGSRAAPAPSGPAPWSVNLTDEDSRTLTTEEVVALWQAGGLPDDAYAWRDDLPDWLPVMDIPELAAAIGNAQAAAPPPDLFGGAAAGAARVSPRASQSDLFAEPDDADEGAPPAAGPSRPGMGAYDDKPSGARNENSVLFTLDAMKSGPKGGAAAPRAALAPKAPSGARPPRREGPAPETTLDDLMGVSAAPVHFSAPNMTDLLAAAPPPPPVEAPSPSQAVPAQATPADAKKRTALIAVGVAAIFALGVGSALALGGKKDEGSAGTAAPTASPAAATATAPATATAVAAPAPSPVVPTAEAVASAAPAAAAPAAEAGKPVSGAAPVPGPLPKPGEKPAGPAPTVAAAPAGGALPPFNKSAAVAALGAAAGSAGSCKRPDGPTGSGKATVTFAPSGRAVSASVSGGSFGGTAVGGCVASVFRRAKVPPFSGDSVTVSKSFSIN